MPEQVCFPTSARLNSRLLFFVGLSAERRTPWRAVFGRWQVLPASLSSPALKILEARSSSLYGLAIQFVTTLSWGKIRCPAAHNRGSPSTRALQLEPSHVVEELTYTHLPTSIYSNMQVHVQSLKRADCRSGAHQVLMAFGTLGSTLHSTFLVCQHLRVSS